MQGRPNFPRRGGFLFLIHCRSHCSRQAKIHCPFHRNSGTIIRTFYLLKIKKRETCIKNFLFAFCRSPSRQLFTHHVQLCCFHCYFPVLSFTLQSFIPCFWSRESMTIFHSVLKTSRKKARYIFFAHICTRLGKINSKCTFAQGG